VGKARLIKKVFRACQMRVLYKKRMEAGLKIASWKKNFFY
jgi:hypothetical protein